MIASFGDAATEDLYHGRQSSKVRKFSADVVQATLRKLDVLNAAHRLTDLQSPPGNRLEALKGDRQGFHSMQIITESMYCGGRNHDTRKSDSNTPG